MTQLVLLAVEAVIAATAVAGTEVLYILHVYLSQIL